jgi:beta-phosphoglucomutase-like phosphatase (HAD superfamily)
MPERTVVLFDIDGTLIDTGGAGAASWRLAFDELYGIPADIGAFTDTGMTDPEVGRRTFRAVLHRDPNRAEFATLLERRLHHLYQTVAESTGYRVLPGRKTCSRACCERAICSGWSRGTSKLRHTSSCTGLGSTASSPSAATARTPPTARSSPASRCAARRWSPGRRFWRSSPLWSVTRPWT